MLQGSSNGNHGSSSELISFSRDSAKQVLPDDKSLHEDVQIVLIVIAAVRLCLYTLQSVLIFKVLPEDIIFTERHDSRGIT